MNKREENKMSMYLTVQQVTNFHSEVWKNSEAFKNLFHEFETHIQKMSATASVQRKKITGVTKNKKNARINAIEKGLFIAEAVYSYAMIIGDRKTADRVSFRISDMEKTRDTDIISDLRVIYETALNCIDELTDYDVTQEELDEFAVYTEHYASIVESPRQAVTNRARATKQLKEQILKADSILKDHLDRLVIRFKAKSPEFFEQFKFARKIVNLGHRKRKAGIEE